MHNKIVSFLPSQFDTPLSTRALTTTASPFELICSDVVLCFRKLGYFWGIMVPLTPYGSGVLDEFYPSVQNLWAMFVHALLVFFELVFVLSVPFFIFFVGIGCMVYSGIVALIVYILCLGLNGRTCGPTMSDPGILEGYDKKEGEVWIFVNGVAVGDHWLKSNLNRLSLTFRRPIMGIHNPTYGILFDTIQCLIQRDLSYNTPDVRETYTYLKASLLDPSVHKVVLIAHSQGGIIASMALDWLYADLPSSALRLLEVYTFGSAANHFNNPSRSSRSVRDRQDDSEEGPVNANINNESFLAQSTKAFLSSPVTGRQEYDERVVPHIEHYANSGDFISQIGVLEHTKSPKHRNLRFLGRVFEQMGVQGHQFNQHYMDTMFPIDCHTGLVLDHNTFMDAECTVNENLVVSRERTASETVVQTVGRQDSRQIINGDNHGTKDLKAEYVSATKANVDRVKSMQVRAVSRLWLYTNGKVPED